MNYKENHRYILEPYTTPGSRYHCPECHHRTRTFSRYIDTETGEHLSDKAGRCSRENSCGYHHTPKDHFKEHSPTTPRGEWQPGMGFYPHSKPLGYAKQHSKPSFVTTPPPLSAECRTPQLGCDYIAADVVDASFGSYQYNNLIVYIYKILRDSVPFRLIARYRIGTSDHWPGATVFWQTDISGNVRTGKIMLYNPQTGKRVKDPFNHIYWAHKLVGKRGSPEVGESERPEDGKVGSAEEGKLKSVYANNKVIDKASAGFSDLTHLQTSAFQLQQCLFGEHLLAEHPDMPVAIVESEKTAIIAGALLPQYLWLAAGSMHNLNAAKCQVLKGRRVELFPDVNAYAAWQQKAAQLALQLPGTTFTASDYLERNAHKTARTEGWDLADYLVR